MNTIYLVNDNLDISESQVADVELVQEAMHNHDFDCSFYEAYLLWKVYSEAEGEEWVELPDSPHEILASVEIFFEED